MVILQDGSASMRVKDVAGDRWQRSIRFLRTLGDSLSWNDDRIALALFAHIAAPQIRLTNDPNTFFFFLDHLDKAPPFRIEDATTWDTNLELGIYWGLRLIERDEELHGKNRQREAVRAGVGRRGVERRGGEVDEEGATTQRPDLRRRRRHARAAARCRTSRTRRERSWSIPRSRPAPVSIAPGCSGLAAAGDGQYFELDRDGDRHIANAIVDAGKRMAPRSGRQESEDLYWRFLAIAAFFPFIGLSCFCATARNSGSRPSAPPPS